MATSAQRSSAASYAANMSWAETHDWAERTEPARKASPFGLDYWIQKVIEEGVVRPEDRVKAAEAKYRAFQQKNGRRSGAARAKKTAKPRGSNAA